MNRINSLDENIEKLEMKDARELMKKLFDHDSFTELDAFAGFTGKPIGVVTGYGTIEGSTVLAFCQDSKTASAGISKEQVRKIEKIYNLAAKSGLPIIGIYDSKGGNINDGAELLTAYSSLLSLSNKLSGVVPQISVITGVCCGITAMSAISADFVIMTKKAELFLTPPSISITKSESAGSYKGAEKSGVVHMIAEDNDEALNFTKKIISKLPANNLSPIPTDEYSEKENSQQTLAAACENIDNTEIKEIAENIADENNCIELMENFGTPSRIFLASIGGTTATIIAVNGKLTADACSKISRMVSISDSFSIPVITIINCDGFENSSAAEIAGGIRSAAKLSHIYTEATCTKITLIAGKAYGGAYVAIAGANNASDLTLAWPSAIISPMEPNAAVTVLHQEKLQTADRTQLVNEYIEKNADVYAYANQGYIEQIIAPAQTRKSIIDSLDLLAGKRVQTLPKKHGNIQN